jgi:hypothetical protein
MKVFITIRDTEKSRVIRTKKIKKAIAKVCGCKKSAVEKKGQAYGVKFFAVRGLSVEAQKH